MMRFQLANEWHAASPQRVEGDVYRHLVHVDRFFPVPSAQHHPQSLGTSRCPGLLVQRHFELGSLPRLQALALLLTTVPDRAHIVGPGFGSVGCVCALRSSLVLFLVVVIVTSDTLWGRRKR